MINRKIPYELKQDKDGLLFTDNYMLVRQSPLNIDTRDYLKEKYYLNMFFPLYSNKDYIIKYCLTAYTRKEIKALKKMLEIMASRQHLINKTDFPIGYFKQGRKLSGFVIPYYENGMSFDHLLDDGNIDKVKEYYLHDDDSIHNVFLMLLDVIDAVNEMFDNNIYYSYFHSDDIILHNNIMSLIDFDHHNVKFDNKDKYFLVAIRSFLRLLDWMLKCYKLSEGIDTQENIQSFEEVKRFTKTIENKVRKD